MVGEGAIGGEAGGQGSINHQRRYFLIGATAVVGGVGLVATAIPFVRSWAPSAKARALGAPIKIDVSKLKPGEMLGPIPAWRGKPVFVVYRTEAALAGLEPQNDALADPNSERSAVAGYAKPEYAQNTWRSRRPELGVFVGICTHLGCSPKYVAVGPRGTDVDWKGGFVCACHGSLYDLAGRVEKGFPAPDNLPVPPYSFESDNVIVIGVDEETA